MKTEHLTPTMENCRWQRITDFFMKRRRYRRDEMLCPVIFPNPPCDSQAEPAGRHHPRNRADADVVTRVFQPAAASPISQRQGGRRCGVCGFENPQFSRLGSRRRGGVAKLRPTRAKDLLRACGDDRPAGKFAIGIFCNARILREKFAASIRGENCSSSPRTALSQRIFF